MDLSKFETCELSALRYAMAQELDSIKQGSMDKLNPCFAFSAHDMLKQCIRSLDEYMSKRGYIVINGVYEHELLCH